MGLKVLLIDDSSVMRKMVARSLRQAGVDVSNTDEASNGLEGLQALQGSEVDVVLCDWNMPEMNGIDFVREARKSHQTPIIMVTTEGSEERVAEAMSAGADGYITKPFTPEQLGAKIDLVVNS